MSPSFGVGVFELLICVGAPLLILVAVALVLVVATTRRK
jgi:hypothetical protein